MSVDDCVDYINKPYISYHSRLLLAFITDGDPYTWKGYLIAVALFVVPTLQAILRQYWFKLNMIVGLRMRSIAIAAVYRKVHSIPYNTYPRGGWGGSSLIEGCIYFIGFTTKVLSKVLHFMRTKPAFPKQPSFVSLFNFCIICMDSPSIIHGRTSDRMHVCMTSLLNVALVHKPRWSLMSLAYFWTCYLWVFVEPGTSRRSFHWCRNWMFVL